MWQLDKINNRIKITEIKQKMKTKIEDTHINVLLLENQKLKWLLWNNQDIGYNTYN